MLNITGKYRTLRRAVACGAVRCSVDTLTQIRAGSLPKGELLNVARAAGLLAAKQTPHLLPHCHPIPLEHMGIDFILVDGSTEVAYPAKYPVLRDFTGILITAEAASIARTGIEMEVLTAVSVTALTIYDMLKPVEKQLVIEQIMLIKKTGGKSSYAHYLNKLPSCGILVCSDSTARGERQDGSGKMIQQMLTSVGVERLAYAIVPDETDAIERQIREWVSQGVEYIFTTGGTGLGPRDITVETVERMFERRADGIIRAVHAYGQERTPLAMMSRMVAGTIGTTTILTLPGSTNGAREGMEAILPVIFHADKMLKGDGHP